MRSFFVFWGGEKKEGGKEEISKERERERDVSLKMSQECCGTGGIQIQCGAGSIFHVVISNVFSCGTLALMVMVFLGEGRVVVVTTGSVVVMMSPRHAAVVWRKRRLAAATGFSGHGKDRVIGFDRWSQMCRNKGRGPCGNRRSRVVVTCQTQRGRATVVIG